MWGHMAITASCVTKPAPAKMLSEFITLGTTTRSKKNVYVLMYKDENGKWVCNNCSYISYSSTSVREHVESKHIESQNYPCNICGHVCPTRKALKMHIFRNKHYS